MDSYVDDDGLVVSAELLRRQLADILAAWGMPADYIEQTADVMIDTDLCGIDSHGVGMLSAYNSWRKMGKLIFDAPITVVNDIPSMALLDGGSGLGHPAGTKAMAMAIDKAKATGVGMVTVRKSNHFGAAGFYAKMALEHDLIGIAMTGTPGAAVVPTFGKQNMLGTNPIAFAAPTRRNPAFLLDMATSTVAVGKLAISARLGKPIPVGWALDDDGEPTTDAAIARESRRLTPVGGTRELGSHKGYGLAAMVEILSSVMSGASIVCVEQSKGGDRFIIGDVGHFLMAADPAALRGDDLFQEELDEYIDTLRATEPTDPDNPVQVAGDPEWLSFEKRSQEGIPLSAALADEIRDVAEEAGIGFILQN